jgi:hypothetical protein
MTDQNDFCATEGSGDTLAHLKDLERRSRRDADVRDALERVRDACVHALEVLGAG